MFKKFYIIFCLIVFLVIPFFSAQAGIFDKESGIRGTDLNFDPQVEIPGEKMGGEDISPGKSIEITSTSFSEYVVAIYNWSLRALAILAVVMIMVGGFRWVTAGGNATVTGKAKDQIISALVGLLIGLGSYALLNFINPSLTILRDLSLDPIEKEVELTEKEKKTGSSCIRVEAGFLRPQKNGYYNEDGECVSCKDWVLGRYCSTDPEIFNNNDKIYPCYACLGPGYFCGIENFEYENTIPLEKTGIVNIGGSEYNSAEIRRCKYTYI